jgi:hypothetical protein
MRFWRGQSSSKPTSSSEHHMQDLCRFWNSQNPTTKPWPQLSDNGHPVDGALGGAGSEPAPSLQTSLNGSAPSLMPYSSSFTKHSCKSLMESSCKSTKGKQDKKGPNYADQQFLCKFECSDPLFSFVIWSTQFAQTTNFSVNLSLVAHYFHLKTGVPSLLLRPQSSPNWGLWSPLEYSVCCFNSKLW